MSGAARGPLQTEPWLLDEPITLGPHSLRGRIYIPAHQCGMAKDGRPSPAYIEYHRVRARGGAAMQITGATPVMWSNLWGSGRALLNIDESIVPGYQQLADAIHSEGGKMLAQLAHPGPTDDRGRNVFGPSRIFSEISRQVTREASTAELDEVVRHFANAADRCRRGGLDGIEVTLAHGLLLAAFLSPLTNFRRDEYGGSLENRVAFPLRVVRAVRDIVGTDMIVGVRLPADDLVPGGIGPDDAAGMAKYLEPYVDYISVIAGNNNRFEARVNHWPPAPAPPGLFRGLARAVKNAVSVPVCAVGRITTPVLANDIIASGDADLVGMVRAHIADPELLAKTRQGRRADIRVCVGCNFCITEDLAGRAVRCAVNPEVSRQDWPRVARRENAARAVVVGGGVAGLEAARRLALKGMEVVLFERADTVGGQTFAWSGSTSRAEFREFLAWEQRQLASLGVEVRLGVEATAEDVLAEHPAAVVLATGSLPSKPQFPSDDSVRCVDVLSALETPPQGRVVVYDSVGALDGALIAERVAEASQGDVTLVTSRLHVGEGDGITAFFPMLRRLADLGVHVVERAWIDRVCQGVVHLKGVFGEERAPVAADVVVTWQGGVSQTGLQDSLTHAGLSPFVIGDAYRPRRVPDAVEDGLSVALQVVDLLDSGPLPHEGEYASV